MMNCCLPSRYVPLLIGKSGVNTKEVYNKCRVKVHFQDSEEGEKGQSSNMTLTGPLLGVGTGYLMMMRKFLEVEARQQEIEERQAEAEARCAEDI